MQNIHKPHGQATAFASNKGTLFRIDKKRKYYCHRKSRKVYMNLCEIMTV